MNYNPSISSISGPIKETKKYPYFCYFNSKNDDNFLNVITKINSIGQLNYITDICKFIDSQKNAMPQCIVERLKKKQIQFPILMMPGGNIIHGIDKVSDLLLGMAENNRLSQYNEINGGNYCSLENFSNGMNSNCGVISLDSSFAMLSTGTGVQGVPDSVEFIKDESLIRKLNHNANNINYNPDDYLK